MITSRITRNTIEPEEIFIPKDYCKYGNYSIVSFPIMRTSFFELANEGWWLFVCTKFLHNLGQYRILYRFYDPKGNGNPHISLKILCRDKGDCPIKLLVSQDLSKCSLSRTQPILLNRDALKSDLEILQTMNSKFNRKRFLEKRNNVIRLKKYDHVEEFLETG